MTVEAEDTIVQVETEHGAVVPVESPPPPATPRKLQRPEKLAIIQVPETISQECLDFIKSNLDSVVQQLGLDGSEIRMLKPEKGGRPKRFLTKQDEQQHYREHFKKYYSEKLTKEGTCPHCDKVFKTFTSVARHIRKSKTCMLLRAQRENAELRAISERPDPELGATADEGGDGQEEAKVVAST